MGGVAVGQWPPTVLVVEDSPQVRRAIRRVLVDAGARTLEAAGVEDALTIFEGERPDLALVDIALAPTSGDRQGLDLVKQVRAMGLTTPIAMLSGSRDPFHLQESMRLGAVDYIFKEELDRTLFVELLREHARPPGRVPALVGRSARVEQLRRVIERVAASGDCVLVRGEVGTGKGTIARAIHEASGRRDQPFVAVPCSALVADEIAPTLFGVDGPGRLETAGQGTLYLAEVSRLPPDTQARLFRALEEGRFQRPGQPNEVRLAARVVASTTVDLAAAVGRGDFHAELFYRLGAVTVQVPSLAERREDIPEVVNALLGEQSRRLRLTDAALDALSRRSWAGNVRALRNTIFSLAMLAQTDEVGVETLAEVLSDSGPPTSQVAGGVAPPSPSARALDLNEIAELVLSIPETDGARLRRLEDVLIESALRHARGNKSSAARMLGVGRKLIERRLRALERGEPTSTRTMRRPR